MISPYESTFRLFIHTGLDTFKLKHWKPSHFPCIHKSYIIEMSASLTRWSINSLLIQSQHKDLFYWTQPFEYLQPPILWIVTNPIHSHQSQQILMHLSEPNINLLEPLDVNRHCSPLSMFNLERNLFEPNKRMSWTWIASQSIAQTPFSVCLNPSTYIALYKPSPYKAVNQSSLS